MAQTGQVHPSLPWVYLVTNNLLGQRASPTDAWSNKVSGLVHNRNI